MDGAGPLRPVIGERLWLVGGQKHQDQGGFGDEIHGRNIGSGRWRWAGFQVKGKRDPDKGVEEA
jgi:hypothetical protein